MSSPGIHNLIYSIEGCEDYVDIYVKEIDGSDQIVCPSQSVFNMIGSPNGDMVWNSCN